MWQSEIMTNFMSQSGVAYGHTVDADRDGVRATGEIATSACGVAYHVHIYGVGHIVADHHLKTLVKIVFEISRIVDEFYRPFDIKIKANRIIFLIEFTNHLEQII